MARRLGSTEAENCACGHDNPPAANWCALCGAALGAEPGFAGQGRWDLANLQNHDIERDALQGSTPRLWLSGGPGVWHVSEDGVGNTRARILDVNGFFAGIPRAGFDLGPFSELRAIEATRRGLFALRNRELLAVPRPAEQPWAWTDEAVRLDPPPGTIVGMARAPRGKLYLLLRDEERLHLWTGSRGWHRLASVATLGAATGWLDTVSSDSGDLLFWGGGAIGAFEAGKEHLSLRQAPEIASLPETLRARIPERPAGDWRGWDLETPVLARRSDGGVALVGWSDGAVRADEARNIDDLLAAVSVDGAVIGRTSNAIVRISRTADGVAVLKANASAVEEAAAAPMGEAAAILVPNDEGVQVEIVRGRDRAPPSPIVKQLDRTRGVLPSGAGFEPVPVCVYSGISSPVHYVWVALDPSSARGGTALQRIVRIPYETLAA